MITKNIQRILIVLSVLMGGGITYYFTHQPASNQVLISDQTAAPSTDQVIIDEYDPARDEQEIKNIFYANYYWLYPDTSYDVEKHVGFMLQYKAPNENPLYVGALTLKVLRVNGQFAGFTAYHPETLTRHRLLFLAIKEGFRKRGFGEKLARYALDAMKNAGAKNIVLVTRVNNPAQNIYRRLGFKETSHDSEFLYMALQVQ